MSNSIDQAFLSDIVENPDDDTPKLVYADWLLELSHNPQERAKANLIHLMCKQRDIFENAGCFPKDSHPPLRQALHYLKEAGPQQWNIPTKAPGIFAFRQGFADVLKMLPSALPKLPQKFFANNTVREIRLRGNAPNDFLMRGSLNIAKNNRVKIFDISHLCLHRDSPEALLNMRMQYLRILRICGTWNYLDGGIVDILDGIAARSKDVLWPNLETIDAREARYYADRPIAQPEREGVRIISRALPTKHNPQEPNATFQSHSRPFVSLRYFPAFIDSQASIVEMPIDVVREHGTATYHLYQNVGFLE